MAQSGSLCLVDFLEKEAGDMMAWLQNFSLIMRSSLTSIREKVEDPERMLHQLIIDMEEELQTIRNRVAGAIADEIQLRKQVEKARADVDQWKSRAGQAVQRSDSTAAFAALQQKQASEERARQLSAEHGRQAAETRKLQEAVRDLEDKIRQARQKQTLLTARLARAESSSRIQQALSQAESASAFAQFNRLEQRVERAEAMSEAYDRLEGRDPDAAELERQFREQERTEQVEAELAALKAELAADE